MTDINCSCDCVYQKDGKCNFENVTATKLSHSSDCIYYSKKPNKTESIREI